MEGVAGGGAATQSEARYAVQWITTGLGEEGSYGTLTASQLQRPKPPFSKSLLKRWIQDHAACEVIHVRPVFLALYFCLYGLK